MPKEPEGTSSAPEDNPGSQADSHASSQEQTKLKHSAASNVDDAKGEGFDQIQASSSLADKEKAASSQSSFLRSTRNRRSEKCSRNGEHLICRFVV